LGKIAIVNSWLRDEEKKDDDSAII